MQLSFATMCMALMVFCFSRADAQHEAMPKDDELLREFRDHRAEFESLRRMVTEDRHQTSFFSESNISSALPDARRSEYRRLLRLYRGLTIGVDNDGGVRFVFASTGQAIGSGRAKGIQFVPDKSKLIGARMDNLDATEKLQAGVYLREIEPRWFLFYQRDE
jgi:hypothetical protein